MSEPNIQPIAGNMLTLSEEDADLLRTTAASVVELQAELGAEYERHLAARERITLSLDNARKQYLALVEAFSTKYVKQPGSYDFRPELGAFVTRGE